MEFDYAGMNQVVYQENGVTIRSFPAVHAIDGSVSYSLEWNGLKYVFAGDTYPNKWYVKYAAGADLAIHECFPTMDQLVEQYKFAPPTAINVAIHVHTAPAAFGAVMQLVKPRMAVAWHFYNDFDTRYDVYEQIRSQYDGPLALATDLIVFNVTKESIKGARSDRQPQHLAGTARLSSFSAGSFPADGAFGFHQFRHDGGFG